MGRCWGWDGGWTGGVADQPEKKEVQRHGPPPCGMAGVADRTGSALRAKRMGLRYLRLELLTHEYARRLRADAHCAWFYWG